MHIARIWKQSIHTWEGVRYANPLCVVSTAVGTYLHEQGIQNETLNRFTATEFRRVLQICDEKTGGRHTASFQDVACTIVSRDVLVLIREHQDIPLFA